MAGLYRLVTAFDESNSPSSMKPMHPNQASGDDKKESLYEHLLRMHQEEEEKRKSAASLSARVLISRPYSMTPTMTRAASSSTCETTYSDSRAYHPSSESANQRQPAVRQSSFYKAAMEAMGEHVERPKPDVSLDEQFAKELSRQAEEEEEEERAKRLRDETLARELAETLRIDADEATRRLRDEALSRDLAEILRMEASEATERYEQLARDEAFALELTRKEQLTLSQPSRTESVKDEAIALALMRAESHTTSPRPSQQEIDEDAALALALAQEENPFPRAPPSTIALPEQLKILEHIKNRREQNMNKGILESSDDFVMSQMLAMQDWMQCKDRQKPAPSLRNTASWSVSSTQPQPQGNGQHPKAFTRPNLGENSLMYSQSDYLFLQSDSSQQLTMEPPRYSCPMQAPQHGLSDEGLRRYAYAQNDQHSLSPHRKKQHVHPDGESVQSAPVQRGTTDFLDRSHQPTPDLLVRGHIPDLLVRGRMETRVAIDQGMSHVVLCQGCNKRLHAPMSYALVFCPSCHTVSPGETAVRTEHLQK